MFIVYRSNRLEVFADQLAALVCQPTNSPFVPDTIIVQSLGIARWLPFGLAEHLGVCAHRWFPFPAAFVWEILRGMLTNVPKTSLIAPDVLLTAH
jgi:exodeoxyribonuclease V gamma subunit